MSLKRMQSFTNNPCLETDDGRVLFFDGEKRNEGGFGVVYKAHFDCSSTPVAVKFMLERDVSELSEKFKKEVAEKDAARFENEIACLIEMRQKGDVFPEYYGRGIWNGYPFYVMEWLSPIDLTTFETDDQRYEYVYTVCWAVLTLHEAGYVHYDIKPDNIMRREKNGDRPEYVLIDFGSVHKIETESDVCQSPDNSVSQLSDGRRAYPHTPGYADLLDRHHTVNMDIYAIGQVIRDLFPETVPPAWARIIDRCTIRNRQYRYRTIDAILRDLLGLKRMTYSFIASEDHSIWMAQRGVMSETPVEMTVASLLRELEEGSYSDGLWDAGYPAQRSTRRISELFIDFGKLSHRNILIKSRIHMTKSALLVVRGNGRISVDLDGRQDLSPSGAFDDFLEDAGDEWRYPFVILLDGASLDNRTRLNNEQARLMYMVGRYCLLNFSSRSTSTPAEDPSYILTGRAGYSFVRNGAENWDKGLYGILKEGNTDLYTQLMWNHFDLPELLRRLRQTRRKDAQGPVQEWLEQNVWTVLMRNMGRFNV